MAKLTREQIGTIVAAVQQHYFGETPAPKFVTVDPKSVHPDKVDSTRFFAKVVIEMEYVTGSTKSHTLHIRFQLDSTKKTLVPSSISYL